MDRFNHNGVLRLLKYFVRFFVSLSFSVSVLFISLLACLIFCHFIFCFRVFRFSFVFVLIFMSHSSTICPELLNFALYGGLFSFSFLIVFVIRCTVVYISFLICRRLSTDDLGYSCSGSRG